MTTPHYPPLDDPDAKVFWKAILAAPDEDLHRLVFADWLQEHGHEADAVYIRTAVDFARRPPCLSCNQTGAVRVGGVEPMSVKVADCVTCDRRGGAEHWKYQQTLFGRWRWGSADLDQWVRANGGTPHAACVPKWSRGFPETIVCTPAGFFADAFAREMVRAAPLTRIDLRYYRPVGILDTHVVSERGHRGVARRVGYAWQRHRQEDVAEIGEYTPYDGYVPYVVPAVLFDRFDARGLGRSAVNGEVDYGGLDVYPESPMRVFQSTVLALDALSKAAVDYSREQAGMPPLPLPRGRAVKMTIVDGGRDPT